MAMIVKHNLQAMNSNRMLGINSATQAKSTEKLSSGYKIITVQLMMQPAYLFPKR